MFLRIGPTRISFEKQWQDDRSQKESENWSEALLELEQCSFSVLKNWLRGLDKNRSLYRIALKQTVFEKNQNNDFRNSTKRTAFEKCIHTAVFHHCIKSICFPTCSNWMRSGKSRKRSAFENFRINEGFRYRNANSSFLVWTKCYGKLTNLSKINSSLDFNFKG